MKNIPCGPWYFQFRTSLSLVVCAAAGTVADVETAMAAVKASSVDRKTEVIGALLQRLSRPGNASPFECSHLPPISCYSGAEKYSLDFRPFHEALTHPELCRRSRA